MEDVCFLKKKCFLLSVSDFSTRHSTPIFKCSAFFESGLYLVGAIKWSPSFNFLVIFLDNLEKTQE